MTSAPEMRLLGIALLAALLAGCGPTRVKVEGSFPEPLMEPLPLTMGVWYSEEFASHEFFDEAKSRSESGWVVNTGEAQVAMWDKLLGGMFYQLVHMKGKPGPGQMNPVVNAVLIPHVDELQYAIPQHTNVKVYEIWMRYRFELLTTGGKPIAEWTMPAYGKTPTAFLRSDEAAVNLAAVMALRDAGANFATSFTRVPAVVEWLNGRKAGQLPDVGHTMPATVGTDSDTVPVPVVDSGDPGAAQAAGETEEVEQ
ncbi:hypothetical protein [Seongchinamella sediminis]|uniref:hypothetical protein n=1 Tax=Seongchinamella sediminis TaxID=2283635 RepID=UPI0019686453|nr:hypothetical protein [Seongchinamella sediminis]